MRGVARERIDELRARGLTLREIAGILGVSKQAVGYYRPKPLEDYGYYSLEGAARLLSVGKEPLRKACGRLGVEPRRTPGGKPVLGPGQVETLRRHFGERKCRMCGGNLPPGHWAYCSEACRREGQKHKYRPEWQREKHKMLERRRYRARKLQSL